MRRDVPLVNEEFWSGILDRKGLSDLEWAMLVFIAEHMRKNFCPPRIIDICDHFNYTSSNAPMRPLRTLVEKGRIERQSGRHSGIILTGVEWIPRRIKKAKDPEAEQVEAADDVAVVS